MKTVNGALEPGTYFVRVGKRLTVFPPAEEDGYEGDIEDVVNGLASEKTLIVKPSRKLVVVEFCQPQNIVGLSITTRQLHRSAEDVSGKPPRRKKRKR